MCIDRWNACKFTKVYFIECDDILSIMTEMDMFDGIWQITQFNFNRRVNEHSCKSFAGFQQLAKNYVSISVSIGVVPYQSTCIDRVEKGRNVPGIDVT